MTKHTTDARATHTAAPGAPAKDAPRIGNDEGEPQTKFLRPAAGGSYTIDQAGALKRNVEPTTVPEYAPITDLTHDPVTGERVTDVHFVRNNDKGTLERVPATAKPKE